MTQEDKELLIKDLCARLPYGVKFNYGGCDGCDYKVELMTSAFVNDFPIEDIKPYLRPLSNMTKEEKHELLRFGVVSLDMDNNANDVCCVGFWNHAKVQDYLNSIHVDYRRLIENGLAIEAPEGMYY